MPENMIICPDKTQNALQRYGFSWRYGFFLMSFFLLIKLACNNLLILKDHPYEISTSTNLTSVYLI